MSSRFMNLAQKDTQQGQCLPDPSNGIASAEALKATKPTQRVTRRGKDLYVGDDKFVAVGPNIYWLGLDEAPDKSNVFFPSHNRVNEALAIARVMGANTVRSLTIGETVGRDKSFEPSYGIFNYTNLESIDYAIYAAGKYGLRLIVPLLDVNPFYQGSISTFLGFLNIPGEQHEKFYDLNGPVYKLYMQYLTNLLNHRSTYTNLTMGEDPTIMAFETGNELGGWDHAHNPPAAWTRNISLEIKKMAPQTLIMSGTFGVFQEELGIDSVDMYSDHFYPISTNILATDVHMTHQADKVLVVGEYAWNSKNEDKALYACIVIGFVVPIIAFFIPRSMLPFYIPLPKWFRKFSRNKGHNSGQNNDANGPQNDEEAGNMRRFSNEEISHRDADDNDKGVSEKGKYLETDDSTGRGSDTTNQPPGIPVQRVVSLTTSINAPTNSDAGSFMENEEDEDDDDDAASIASSISQTSYYGGMGRHSHDPAEDLDPGRPYWKIWRYHIYILLVIIFVPIITGLVYRFQPRPLNTFQQDMVDASKNSNSLGGSLYWSLFGRDEDCCHYVEHNDNYTLHYPANGDAGKYKAQISNLVRTTYELSGLDPKIAGWNSKFNNFPPVACRQRPLL